MTHKGSRYKRDFETGYIRAVMTYADWWWTAPYSEAYKSDDILLLMMFMIVLDEREAWRIKDLATKGSYCTWYIRAVLTYADWWWTAPYSEAYKSDDILLLRMFMIVLDGRKAWRLKDLATKGTSRLDILELYWLMQTKDGPPKVARLTSPMIFCYCGCSWSYWMGERHDA